MLWSSRANARLAPKLPPSGCSCGAVAHWFGHCDPSDCDADQRAALHGLAAAAATGCAGWCALGCRGQRLAKGRGRKSWKSGAARREQSENSVGSQMYGTTCVAGVSTESNSWDTFVGAGLDAISACRSGAAATSGPCPSPAAARLREDGGEHGAHGALAGAGHQLHHGGLAKLAPNLHGRLIAQRGGQPARGAWIGCRLMVVNWHGRCTVAGAGCTQLRVLGQSSPKQSRHATHCTQHPAPTDLSCGRASSLSSKLGVKESSGWGGPPPCSSGAGSPPWAARRRSSRCRWIRVMRSSMSK